MENEWIVIEIVLPGAQVDAVCALLNDAGANGTLVEERQLDSFSVPDEGLDPAAVYTIKAYFAEEKDPNAISDRVQGQLKSLIAENGEIKVGEPARVRTEDWAECWKQHFPVQKFGRRLVIRPSWENYQASSQEVILELDPGMAFGTGTHGTTLLCLNLVVELLESSAPPKSFLDVGTGSGILAMAAAGLGCPMVVANDIDPQACEVARENARRNQLDRRLAISDRPLEELGGQFDLVVANILAEENIRLKQAFLNHLAPRGWLVLSGILREKENLVRAAFANLPLQDMPSRYEDDWVCLSYRYGR